eukprot:3936978-Rhodomonas_salina.1
MSLSMCMAESSAVAVVDSSDGAIVHHTSTSDIKVKTSARFHIRAGLTLVGVWCCCDRMLGHRLVLFSIEWSVASLCRPGPQLMSLGCVVAGLKGCWLKGGRVPRVRVRGVGEVVEV